MPAVNCDPAALVEAAKCMECIPKAMQLPVELYLLASIAGLPTDKAGVDAIVEAARCFACARGMLPEVQAYLLCQIAG